MKVYSKIIQQRFGLTGQFMDDYYLLNGIVPLWSRALFCKFVLEHNDDYKHESKCRLI